MTVLESSGGADTGAAPAPERARAVVRSNLVAGLAALLIVASGALVAVLAQREFRADEDVWRFRLAAMADDRKSAIDRWLRDNLNNAARIASFPTVRAIALAAPSGGPGAGAGEVPVGHAAEILQVETALGGYRLAVLTDRDGRVLAGAGEVADLGPDDMTLVRRCLSGSPLLADIGRRNGGKPSVQFAAAVVAGPGEAPAGVVVLTTDPDRWLYPFLRHEPAPSLTAETLLVGREADAVVFLSPLRNSAAPPLTLRRPLTQAGLAAAAALGGGAAFGDYTDYRGEPVDAVTTRLANAPWGLVAKVDRSEIVLSLRHWLVGAVALWLALVAASSGLAFGIAQRHKALMRAAVTGEQQRLAELVHNANDAVFILATDGRFLDANRKAEEMYGYSHTELLSLSTADVRAAATRASARHDLDEALQRDGSIYETVHCRKDGSEFSAEVSLRHADVQGTRYLIASIRDVTAHRQAEARIRRLNRLFLTVSEVNQLIVRERDRGRLLEEACRIVAEHGGFRMGWIGFLDEASGRLLPASAAGQGTDYLREVADGAGGPDLSRSPTATALRERRTVIANDWTTDPSIAPWRSAGLAHGFRSSACFPVPTTRSPVGVMAVYSAEPDAFDDENVALLAALAGDIAFGLDAIAREDELTSATEALRENERRLAAILENVQDAYFRADLDGVLVAASPSAARMYGYASADAMVGLSAGRLYADPAERDSILSEVVRSGHVHDRVGRGRRGDGTEFWVSLNTQFVRDERGRIVGTEGFARDITERMTSERERLRLAAIVESTGDAVIAKTLEGVIVSWNEGAERLYGYTSAEAVGRNVALIVPPEQIGELPALLGRLRDGERISHFETTRIRKDGTRVEVSLSLSPITDHRGAVVGASTIARDVTERRRAEAARHESEEKFRTAFANNPAWLTIVDMKTRRTMEVNDAWCQVFGYSREEAIGRTVPEMGIYEEATFDAILEEVEAKGSVRNAEVTLVTRRGPRVELVSRDRIVVGGETYLLAMGLDITDRVAAERALRESEARYRGLFENSPIGIYRTTPGGEILLANPALLAMLGYSSLDELRGHNLEVMGFEPEYPRARFKELVERGGFIKGFEARWVRRDGKALVVRESAQAIRGADGAVLYYEGAVEDVTARTLAEEERRRLATAIEQSPEAVMITDPDGTIRYVNPAFEWITGYRADEAIGGDSRILKSDRQPAAFYAEMWTTILGGSTWMGRLTNRRKDGSLYEEEMSISPVRNERGELINFVAVKRDVTREVELQQQLAQAQRMEAIGRLAGGIAHDFNNLLQALISQVQLVRSQAGEPEKVTDLSVELEQQITRGASLTRQLLLFSRRETVKPERLDLNEAVTGAASMLKRLVRANVVLDFELAPEPLPVQADRGQLDQVLMNLAVNAADAMPGGGRISVRTGSDGAKGVWLAVADRGHGIPPGIRDRIFEPFFTTKGSGKGTGLGLAVVHGIVAQHGGRIEVDSTVGEGTTFTITLPRGGSGDPSAAPMPAPEELPRGRGERVLVVEDEATAREALREILTGLGYRVVALGSGEEADALPGEPPFDLLLTDLMLPGVGGAALAKRLTDRWPALKVVLMAGYAADEAVRTGVGAGALRFLQKPFDMRTLVREVRSALDERKP